MTDESKPLEEGTPPLAADEPKKKTWSRRKKTVEVPVSMLETMQKQIAALQSQVAAQQIKQDAMPETDVEVPSVAPDGTKRVPGQIINISTDPTKPEFRQVRWTRDDVNKAYPLVEINPEVNLHVAPHGIGFQLLRRRRATVPSIVRDMYEAELARLEHPFQVPGLGDVTPLSPLEDATLAQQAVITGQKAQSRVHFLGVGLNLGQAPATETEAEATTVTSNRSA